MNSPVIVALDYPDSELALALASKLDPEQCRVKVGKELFTRSGPDVVAALHDQGFDVFLDLKFHDIPNTVAGAVRAAAEMGVWMVNVHTSGGSRMMSAARGALEGLSNPPLLIGVTVLTSMDDADLKEIGIQSPAADQVAALAELASSAGLDGVVCSAGEASLLKPRHGDYFKLVTPGIRIAGDDTGDQRRVLTPAAAMAAGSDYLVIGRSITGSADPAATTRRVVEELADLT